MTMSPFLASLSDLPHIESLSVLGAESEKRMNFLPTHFGRGLLIAELAMFVFLEKMVHGYRGGMLEFIEVNIDSEDFGRVALPLLAHDSNAASLMVGHPEGYCGPFAFSSLLTSLVLNAYISSHCAIHFHSKGWNKEAEVLSRNYEILRELMYELAEREGKTSEVFQLTD